jgi:hypothetical protein
VNVVKKVHVWERGGKINVAKMITWTKFMDKL